MRGQQIYHHNCTYINTFFKNIRGQKKDRKRSQCHWYNVCIYVYIILYICVCLIHYNIILYFNIKTFGAFLLVWRCLNVNTQSQ